MSGTTPEPASGSGTPAASWSRPAFLRAPLVMQLFLVVVVAAALVLPFTLRHLGQVQSHNPLAATLLSLVVISVVNVEISRLLEGGRSDGQRPHKALSAWSFCSALLLPTPYLLPVVAISYGHARWRGLRVPLWKWVGSAAYVVLAGLVAAIVARAVNGDETNWMAGDGGLGLLACVLAAAAFLVVETVLFHASAYLNDAEDEVWLRRTLASRSFYATEAAVLLMGALSAAVWTAGAWFMLLLVPVYGLAQRAALHVPLRERAETDEKTGLLRFESWRLLAVSEQQRCAARERAWSVAFADLDHFKRYNDAFGHLAGDAALAAVAVVLRGQLRSRDLVGRFGGEEFCLFLPDTPAAEAGAIAERITAAVSGVPLPTGGHVTVSVGVVSFPAGSGPVQLVDALTAADRALFEAKVSGRDRVCLHELDPEDPAWHEAAPVVRGARD